MLSFSCFCCFVLLAAVALKVGYLDVRFLVSSVDVIHCYSVPGLGVKVDAILGRSSLVNVTGLVQGYYTGYCAELCGSGHGSCLVVLLCMPASSF